MSKRKISMEVYEIGDRTIFDTYEAVSEVQVNIVRQSMPTSELEQMEQPDLFVAEVFASHIRKLYPIKGPIGGKSAS